jgi:hypothetical protein
MENKGVESEESSKIREGNISLVLDSYDAIFSDFDPRPYQEKSISDDFILECKKATLDKKGLIELRLLIPLQLRKIHEEVKIKKRLKEYFKKHLHEEEKRIKAIKRNGWLWFFIGSIILTISTFLYEFKPEFSNQFVKFMYNFLVIISQPSGWFILWSGLDMTFLKSKEELPNYEFLKKMLNANIYFLNY